jgi:Recombinational DNA repair ATPase (RecF pathway)
MLERIVIENYRSCLRTSLDFHPALSVLIGPNGSGKTNILQAILFLQKIADEQSHRPFEVDAVTANSRIKASIRIGQRQSRLSASVDSYADSGNNDVVKASKQKWVVTGRRSQKATIDAPLSLARYITPNRARQNLRRHYYFPQVSESALRSARAAPRWALNVLRKTAEFCSGITYYGASQFTNPAACPVSFDMEREGTRRGFPHLRGHARILYSMYVAQKAGDEKQFAEFDRVVGPKGLKLVDAISFREVTTSTVDHSVRIGGKVVRRRKHQLLIVPQFRVGKQKLSPNQLSEGTFKTLALLFYIITADSTALLIEEPEVCVHHGLLSSILELIKSYSRDKQIVLSTHSDYVLDHIKPENVFRVTRDRQIGTNVRQIRNTMTAAEFDALRVYLDDSGNLGEYWREGGLGDRA